MARCTSASETLAWAARLYGRACRNYALEVLSLGGMYVAGVLLQKLPAMLTHKAFSEEFLMSKTMSRILAHIAVSLITNEESGLWEPPYSTTDIEKAGEKTKTFPAGNS